jgi:histidine phosphotransferase ChpT
VPSLLAGKPENDHVDAHGIQAFYTGLVARECGMTLDVSVAAETVVISAMSLAAPAETTEAAA